MPQQYKTAADNSYAPGDLILTHLENRNLFHFRKADCRAGLEAMEIFAGPRPLPLTTKILPNAIPEFG
jgi:hypothetical protein